MKPWIAFAAMTIHETAPDDLHAFPAIRRRPKQMAGRCLCRSRLRQGSQQKYGDGIIFHPTVKGVRYARTDMGGAYRWDDKAKQWSPILDWVSFEDVNLMGVESIAVDPHDARRVYLACGTYSTVPDTAILRSEDGAKTFQRTNVPFRMGGNENGRGDGERLAVDPNDGRVLYFGSRQAGLWRSTDRAVTWQHVDTFPDITEAPPPAPPVAPPLVTAPAAPSVAGSASMAVPAPGTAPVGGIAPSPGTGQRRRGYRPSRTDGIVFVTYDPKSGSDRSPSKTIYVGVSLMGRDNLFRSTDGGATWLPVPGQPTQYRLNHGILATDGVLYLSYGTSPGPNPMRDGGIWKFDTNTSVWTDITPQKPDPANGQAFGYAAVSVDRSHPNALIVSTFGHPGGEEMFRSTDAGASWKPIFHAGGATYDFSEAPYVARTPIHWMFGLQIDPTDSNHAIFTTGYGGYETFDLTDADAGKPTKWSVMSKGIEETVALNLLSPSQGPHLVTAIGDYGGFVHTDLDRALPGAYAENPRFGNTSAVTDASMNPALIVRVGQGTGESNGKNIGYSLDGGTTWQPCAALPQADSRNGTIAVSSDGAAWVWTPDRSVPSLTRDRGATWTDCTGLPMGTRVIADPVNPRKFYGMALFDGKFYTSTDGGATFAAEPLTLPGGLPMAGGDRFDARGGQDKLYAAPGKEGDLWLAAFDGLYHTTDAGVTFVKIDGVPQVHAFGFGKAAPGRADPALYLVGLVDGVRGVFRSDDSAGHWTRINDAAHQWGLILQVLGDPRIYGRVYVGTHGRGTFYADPVTAKS